MFTIEEIDDAIATIQAALEAYPQDSFINESASDLFENAMFHAMEALEGLKV